MVSLFQATCPIVKKKAKNFVSGLIVPGDLPDDKNARKLASGLIVPGDLPD